MTRRFLLIALLCLFATPARAHRLDEYLQASIVALHAGHVTITMRMVPGVAVAPAVVASIDRNGDGVFSPEEQFAYVERIRSDLELSTDGHKVGLAAGDAVFPDMRQLSTGSGQIQLVFSAVLPTADGSHELTFDNRHQPGISAYLVNTLVPKEKHLSITSQSRNRNQSSYRLTYTQGSADREAERQQASGAFEPAFRLGMLHIAEGTDHLLFLLTLLLPAPLLARSGRWSDVASSRHALLQTLRVVTAFTLAHSLTLALASFGMFRLPVRPVEVLIAFSILVSAIHALRPIFPGHEAVIAAAFGLIHGLAFSSAITELGITGWYRVITLCGFNLGIETVQLVIVAGTLPLLVFLSRTRFFTVVRTSGALLAAATATFWIAARLFE